MRTGLVIGGGGSKGAFAMGAVEALRDAGVEFDVIAGTSTGALLAPMIAVGDWTSMVEHYTTVRRRDIIRYNWRGLFWKGLYHTRPLEKRIRRWADEHYNHLMQTTVKVILCACSLQDKQAVYYSQHGCEQTEGWGSRETFVKAVLGSSVQPVFMCPVEMGDEQLIDGGVREIAPVNSVIELGAKKVYVVVHSPEKPKTSTEKYNNLMSIGARTLDLMLDEILLNDVANVLAEFQVELILIRPAGELPLSSLEFDPDKMQEMRKIGRERAESCLQKCVR